MGEVFIDGCEVLMVMGYCWVWVLMSVGLLFGVGC